jgi:hypothetical protein
MDLDVVTEGYSKARAYEQTLAERTGDNLEAELARYADKLRERHSAALEAVGQWEANLRAVMSGDLPPYPDLKLRTRNTSKDEDVTVE